MRHALIVSNIQERKGLWRDSEIISARLGAAGWAVTVVDYRGDPPRAHYDLGIACEVVPGQHVRPMARRWWWIPNPEWAIPSSMETVPIFERILLKTASAQAPEWLQRGQVVGFESEDIAPAEFSAPVEFLHLAGGSISRGTAAVGEAWKLAKAKGIPGVLHVVDAPEHPRNREALNQCPALEIHARMAEPQLRALQRRCLVHVLASEHEGWGHTFWEALSLGAVVLGTDGPWWAEARDAYVPVVSHAGGKRMLSDRLAIDVPDLAAQMEWAAASGQPSNLARLTFERARADFRAIFAEVLAEAFPPC